MYSKKGQRENASKLRKMAVVWVGRGESPRLG